MGQKGSTSASGSSAPSAPPAPTPLMAALSSSAARVDKDLAAAVAEATLQERSFQWSHLTPFRAEHEAMVLMDDPELWGMPFYHLPFELLLAVRRDKLRTLALVREQAAQGNAHAISTLAVFVLHGVGEHYVDAQMSAAVHQSRGAAHMQLVVAEAEELSCTGCERDQLENDPAKDGCGGGQMQAFRHLLAEHFNPFDPRVTAPDAWPLFELAASKGSVNAACAILVLQVMGIDRHIGLRHMHSSDVSRAQVEGFEALKNLRAAHPTNPCVAVNLARLTYYGSRGVPENPKATLDLLRAEPLCSMPMWPPVARMRGYFLRTGAGGSEIDKPRARAIYVVLAHAPFHDTESLRLMNRATKSRRARELDKQEAADPHDLFTDAERDRDALWLECTNTGAAVDEKHCVQDLACAYDTIGTVPHVDHDALMATHWTVYGSERGSGVLQWNLTCGLRPDTTEPAGGLTPDALVATVWCSRSAASGHVQAVRYLASLFGTQPVPQTANDFDIRRRGVLHPPGARLSDAKQRFELCGVVPSQRIAYVLRQRLYRQQYRNPLLLWEVGVEHYCGWFERPVPSPPELKDTLPPPPLPGVMGPQFGFAPVAAAAAAASAASSAGRDAAPSASSSSPGSKATDGQHNAVIVPRHVLRAVEVWREAKDEHPAAADTLRDLSLSVEASRTACDSASSERGTSSVYGHEQSAAWLMHYLASSTDSGPQRK